jgi:primase-polymerase (primpol)-like protein
MKSEEVTTMSENKIEQANLPSKLVEVDQWLCWTEEERDGKPTKIPITPGTGAFASSTDRETWTDFETAVDYAASNEADGLGFVFTDEDPFVGIDLDDCREPETERIDDDTREIIARLDSYTEISPSGTGFHVLIEGELPEGRNRKGAVEMYDSARFFTMTGDQVGGTPQRVATRQNALDAIHRDYVQPESRADQQAITDAGDQTGTPTNDVDIDDEELLETARNAKNGEKFARLWNGDIQAYASHSEADMAFCSLLAFWTGGDASRIDALFRDSGLMRAKWDEQHYSDGATYGEKTIQRAIANTTEFYEPPADDAEASAQSQSPERTQTGGQPRQDDEGWKRERAYLQEQNRLLKEKLADYETTIEKQEARIETLESELEDRQRGALTSPSQDTSEDQTSEESTLTEPEDNQSGDESLWSRTKGIISNDGR